MSNDMTKKTKINNIEIGIGDVSVNLTLDQARELNEILNDMFKGKERTTYIPYPVVEPYAPRRNPWDIWYATSSGSTYSLTAKSSGLTGSVTTKVRY